MKQITENALLYRVNQLKEKMAMFEWATAADDRAQKNTASPNAGVQGIPGGVVDQAIATQPATTTPAKPTTNAPPLSQLANPTNKGSGPRVDPTAAPVAPGTAPKPGASAPAGKWPTTHDEIVAFQNANKLNPDGLIGEKTMAALKAQGIQAPAGFKPVANRQHPAAAKPGQKAAAAAQKAAPGTAGYVNPDGTVSSGNAQTDANLAANAAYVNLPSDEQHAINMYHGQQSQKTAASQQAVAQGQANLTSSDPITKAVANAAQNTPLGVNAVPPSSSPGTPSTGGFMQPAFASQQQQPPVPAASTATSEEMKSAQAAVSAYKPNRNAKPYDADYGSNVPGAPGSKEYELVHPSAAEPAPTRDVPPQKPEGVQVFNESPDHVTFGDDQALARILQLVKW